MSDARRAVENMSKAEGDRICRMVRDLVLELARGQGLRPDPQRGVEPTGITVVPEMRPYVEQRSTARMTEGRAMRKKAS